MQQRSPTGSGRRWTRSLAGQIAILAAVPTAAVLLAVAVLTLFLNQHSRLDTLLQAETDRALALADPIERTLTGTLRTNLRSTSTTPPNLFLHRTTGARLVQQLDEALQAPAAATLQQARAPLAPSPSPMSSRPPAANP